MKTIRRNQVKKIKEVLNGSGWTAYSLDNGFTGEIMNPYVNNYIEKVMEDIQKGHAKLVFDDQKSTGKELDFYTIEYHSNLWYELKIEKSKF